MTSVDFCSIAAYYDYLLQTTRRSGSSVEWCVLCCLWVARAAARILFGGGGRGAFEDDVPAAFRAQLLALGGDISFVDATAARTLPALGGSFDAGVGGVATFSLKVGATVQLLQPQLKLRDRSNTRGPDLLPGEVARAPVGPPPPPPPNRERAGVVVGQSSLRGGRRGARVASIGGCGRVDLAA